MRQLLEDAKADAPPVRVSVDEIVRAGRRRVRNRWYVRGAGVACGVTAVVLGVATLLPAGNDPVDSVEAGPFGSAAAAVVPAFTTTFSGYAIGDFHIVDPIEVTPSYERTLLQRSNVDVGEGPDVTLDAGTLTVYRQGAFSPDKFRAGTAVTIGGREGFATTLPQKVQVGGPDLESRKDPVTKTFDVPAIAWQYADGAWATIEADYLAQHTVPADVLRQLAERFATREPASVKLPVKVTHVPDGWKLASAGTRGLVSGDAPMALLLYVPANTTALAGQRELNLPDAPAIRISVNPVDTEGPYRHPFNPPCPEGKYFCDVKIDGRYYAEVYDQSGTLSADQIKAIADGLRFATIADKGTWFPVKEG
ncbi:hypothetical protein [Phytohabitans flavus]